MAASRIFGAVIPCYNSSATIAEIVERTENTIKNLGFEPRVICVNDGSNDDTLETLCRCVRNDSNLIVLDLAKNYGQHNALLAGIQNVGRVDFLAGLDDDLQTPPEELIKMFKQLVDNDADVCFGIPDSVRYETYRQLGSSFNRWCSRILTNRPKDSITSSFWLVRGFVVGELLERTDPYPQIQSLFFDVTSKATTCLVEHNARLYGKSGYTVKKLVRQWSRLSNYSEVVLGCLEKACVYLSGLAAVIMTLTVLVYPEKLSHSIELLNTVILIMILIGLSGVLSYLNKTFRMVRGLPPYTIRNRFTCGERTVKQYE